VLLVAPWAAHQVRSAGCVGALAVPEAPWAALRARSAGGGAGEFAVKAPAALAAPGLALESEHFRIAFGKHLPCPGKVIYRG
jgi:hypothetical protein